MHATFIIPGLFPEIPDAAVPRLPHLELALARGMLAVSSGNVMLEGWPEADPETSLAARTALESGLSDLAPYWMRADPVHFQVEGDALLLLERYSFSLTTAESAALLQTLNEHFSDRQLVFCAPQPDVWLVGMQTLPGIRTTHPLTRVGRNIDGYLPQGEHARSWRAIFNEVQMLFHEHPVNLERSTRHQRVISGVWFWDYPATVPEAPVVDHLRLPSAYGDHEAWSKAALALDQDLVAPLLQQLRSGSLQSCMLIGVEGRCSARLTLFPWQLWRLWRRPKPLMRYSGIPALEHT